MTSRMRRKTIFTVVVAVCMLMAVPAMATTVGAQTVDDDDSDDGVDDSDDKTDDDSEETDQEDSEDDGGESDDSEEETDDGDETNESTDNTTAEFSFDAALDNETVTISVERTDSAVENASIAVNGTEAGTTDENGTLQFDLDNRSAVEIGVTVEETTQSTTYEVVDGELVDQQNNEDLEADGPPEEMPDEAADQVSVIHHLINAFRNGEYDQLGPIVSEAAGGGPPADAGNGSGNAPDHAANGSENAPDHAANGSGNAPDHAANGSGNSSDHASNDSGNAPGNASQGTQSDTAGNQANGENTNGDQNSESPGNSGSSNSGGNDGPGANSGAGGPP